MAIIDMKPVPGGSQDGGQLVRDLLAEFLKSFSLRTGEAPAGGPGFGSLPDC